MRHFDQQQIIQNLDKSKATVRAFEQHQEISSSSRYIYMFELYRILINVTYQKVIKTKIVNKCVVFNAMQLNSNT